MHLLYPHPEVTRKTSTKIVVEVSNGRSIGLVAPIFISLAISVWLALVAAILGIIVWTYKREWIVDTATKKITEVSRVLSREHKRIGYSFDELRSLYIIKVNDGDNGYAHSLQLGLADGASSVTIIKTNKRQDLIDLTTDLKPYLPQWIKLNLEHDTVEAETEQAA